MLGEESGFLTTMSIEWGVKLPLDDSAQIPVRRVSVAFDGICERVSDPRVGLSVAYDVKQHRTDSPNARW